MIRLITILTALTLALGTLSACGGAQTKTDGAAAELPAKAVCPVSGEQFTPTASSPKVVHNGKTYYMCCPGCDVKFAKAPEKYLAALKAGTPLEPMGGHPAKKPCTGDCKKEKGDCADCDSPAAAMAGVAASSVGALPAEAKCPVSGKTFKPTADTKVVMHDGKAHYMCCPGCAAKFTANPSQFVAGK